ncbi:hypothetical protein DY000_02044428 [Brassica cretica]|uniref:RING-type domain-containing protein n=1 Tax=Brassica cretica TaxID=69181 RepID=A0ABQ7ENY5_BRACR|nr:hypothetical protein DY000_02044428 [Brassica cretica]
MKIQPGKKAIHPSNEVDNVEEDGDDESSSDGGDSVGSEFQAEEKKEEELLPLIQFLPLPNPVPAPAPVPLMRKGTKRKASREKTKLLWEIWEKEDQEWVDEHKTEDGDLDQLNNVITETVEPPPDLIMPLFRYQKEFLAWATKQEQSAAAGGILADEMGMGKTIQAISLVVARREAVGFTLVICPLVAVSQWLDEIERCTSPGSAKVLVYHGAKKEKNAEEFRKYDFVLTTYSTVENGYRGCIVSPEKRCEFCSESFSPQKLIIHNKYFCGPLAVKTTEQTLEEDQIGSVVKEKPILHSVRWNRIILDEAHNIKERSSSTAKAVFALEANYRWALSGTPLQNHVGEFYSLIRFLQILPYSYYFCRDCDCSILDYTKNTRCHSCPHQAARHFCWWGKNVTKVYGNQERGKRAMIVLKKVLKDILIRRTKLELAADLALPPRIITLRRDALDVKEFDYYESLYKNSQAQFNTYVQAGTWMKKGADIFVLLIRLRQAVDHQYLVEYSPSNLNDENKKEHECGLCHEPAEDNVVTSCAHVFCKACLISFSASLGKVSCPTCSKLLTVDWTTNAGTEQQAESKTTLKGFRASSIMNLIKVDDFQTSTKIEALVFVGISCTTSLNHLVVVRKLIVLSLRILLPLLMYDNMKLRRLHDKTPPKREKRRNIADEDIALGELYVQAGTLMHKCADIFVLLMRLRQAVDHPYIVVYSQSSGANANLNDENKKEHECGLCHEPAEDSVVTSCAHVFCKACLIDFSASLGKVSCPKCSKLLTMGWTTNADTEQQAESKTTLKGFRASSIMNQINLNDFQTSTKIEALREEIRLMVERDVSAKAILFSQFTSFLELINYTLGKVISLCYVSVIILTFVFKQNETLFCLQHSVGLVASNWWEQCPRAARDVAINKFREDPDCKVFLMSMKAGGVALNLTVASHVFMMEPCWNPAVERQAHDRMHRIGQYKPIRVVKFIIENTVEERILKLLFEATVNAHGGIGNWTAEDIEFLFTT